MTITLQQSGRKPQTVEIAPHMEMRLKQLAKANGKTLAQAVRMTIAHSTVEGHVITTPAAIYERNEEASGKRTLRAFRVAKSR